MSQAEREKIEAEYFGMGKVGQKYHAPAAWGPSAWRKTMKYWAALALGIVLGAIAAGVLAVVVGVVR
jgi:hypothetical protein